MAISKFRHTRLESIVTALPPNFIDIDNELAYFDNSSAVLNRVKKFTGYGRRYIADEHTTVSDLAVCAARELIKRSGIDPEKIELLIFVNERPDFPMPSDACLAQYRLGLPKSCATLHVNQGCAGYIHGLWMAHSMIDSGAVHNCLLLAGDLCARTTLQSNRKLAPIFSDSATATFLNHCEEESSATFILGTDGSGFDKIIHPVGGMRLPLTSDNINTTFTDSDGNSWTPGQGMMKGEEVFKFSIHIAPSLIDETLAQAGWLKDEVSLFALHQANKQIVSKIIKRAALPLDKTPTDIFSKYANHSTNSIGTVICDQPSDRKIDKSLLCGFGIGYQWGACALDLSGLKNFGFITYHSDSWGSKYSDINYWKSHFEGERNE